MGDEKVKRITIDELNGLVEFEGFDLGPMKINIEVNNLGDTHIEIHTEQKYMLAEEIKYEPSPRYIIKEVPQQVEVRNHKKEKYILIIVIIVAINILIQILTKL